MGCSPGEEGWALSNTYLRKRGIFSASTKATLVFRGDRVPFLWSQVLWGICTDKQGAPALGPLASTPTFPDQRKRTPLPWPPK